MGDASQQSLDVGGGDDLQEGVGGVVFQPPDLAGSVVEGEALPGAELPNRPLVKPLLPRHAEMQLVPKVNQPHDAPEVVDPVGVVEGHAPAVGLGRETAQEQDAGVRGQEGLEGMLFDGQFSVLNHCVCICSKIRIFCGSMTKNNLQRSNLSKT